LNLSEFSNGCDLNKKRGEAQILAGAQVCISSLLYCFENSTIIFIIFLILTGEKHILWVKDNEHFIITAY